MNNTIRPSAVWLVAASLAAVVFFVATDPAAGWIDWPTQSPVDAHWQARAGTLIGLVGSAFSLLLALFLTTRRSA